jgi:hypothetical protein
MNYTMKKKQVIVVWSLMLITILALGTLLPNSHMANAAPGTDPSKEPIPKLSSDERSKSMVVGLNFKSETDVELSSVEVSFERSRTHIGDPPLLDVKLLNDKGELISQFNSWNPLWSFQYDEDGHEHMVLLSEASGTITFPFQPDLQTMIVTDIPQKKRLILVDLFPPIRAFCEANPNDPDCKISDLAILNVTSVNNTPLIRVGFNAENIPVRTVFVNKGPDASTESVLTLNSRASAGLVVTPEETISHGEDGIQPNQQKQFDQNYNIRCTEPGTYVLTIFASIDAKKAAVSDPDKTNNELTSDILVDCAVPVTINIKPGNPSDLIKLSPKGVVTVALLSTEKGQYGNPLAFDATVIDPLSVRFGDRSLVIDDGGGAPEKHNRGHIRESYEPDDITIDEDADMVLHFNKRPTDLRTSDIEACLKGKSPSESGDDFTFFGCGSVTVVR